MGPSALWNPVGGRARIRSVFGADRAPRSQHPPGADVVDFRKGRRRTRAGIVAIALVATGLAACNPADPPGTMRIDFAPVGATAAPGYTVDSGEAYTAGRGYGWISETSTT